MTHNLTSNPKVLVVEAKSDKSATLNTLVLLGGLIVLIMGIKTMSGF
ncbi:MAG: hypothetical protein L3J65_01290 [Robiginitomaculum sp.]|nr:hypothetical protein [Robiginitomaculum sp.]